MKKVFKKSMREIQSELDDYHLYRENYDFMMFSPMATRLNEKITALTAQNNELQYANRQMRMQLLEYEEHISTFMKKNGGKNGKNLRKLAKKQRQTTQVQEQDNIEEDAILSGGQDGDVVDEIPAPMTIAVSQKVSGKDTNVVEENISFELTEDMSNTQKTGALSDDETSHARSLANELDEEEVVESSEAEAESDDGEEESEETEEAEDEVEEETEEAEEEAEDDAEEAEVEEETEEDEEESKEESKEEVEEETEEAEEESKEESEEEVEDAEEELEETEEEVEDEVEDEAEDNAEAEEEVYEIKINGKQYFTTNEKNGVIYAMDFDGEVGDEIGKYVAGVAIFSK